MIPRPALRLKVRHRGVGRDLRWNWIPCNLPLPLVTALAGTVFYLVLRAGLFSRREAALDRN